MFIITVVALTALLASTSAQPPADCVKLFKTNFEGCCPGVTPPFVKNGPSCGLPDLSNGPPSGPPSGGPPSCDSIKCTFKDYLTGDGKIDQSAFISAMNSYYSGDLKNGVQNAYQKCSSLESSSGPCPIGRFGGCFAMEMFKACPDNGDASCTTAKSLVDVCAPPA